MATSNLSLLNLYTSKLGAQVSVGKDALNAELGKMERQRDEYAKRIKELKRLMEVLPK